MGRKARMRKLLREEDVEELEDLVEQKAGAPKAEPEAETAKSAKADPTARVLELQKAAGNRAVGAALSRWPVFGAPAVAQWPKEAQMILDGTPIPIESVQEGVRGTNVPAGPGTGLTNQKPNVTGPGEVVVTLKMGKYSPDLFQQSLTGSGYKTVEIVIPSKDGKGGVRFILTDVLISNYSISSGSSSPLESLELSFKKREFSHDAPPPNGRR